jgi:hypothetical protein
MKTWVVAVLLVAACDPADPAGEGEGEVSGEGEGEGDDAIDNPWGFSLFAPQDRDVPCVDVSVCPNGTSAARDVGYVCSARIGDAEAVLHIDARPTSVRTDFFALPVYGDVRAQVLQDGVVTNLDGASVGYDYGGNHHNDFFYIIVDDVRYTLNHSSFGFGFRSCQPPDCVQTEGGENDIDGCQPTRTVFAACIEVTDPIAALTDNFMTCPGDPE